MIDVALSPAEISHLKDTDLRDTTVVVFDVLRATSSMITGLAHGVARFFPVKTVEAAREWKKRKPDLLLAGERHGVPPPGFDLGNSPSEFKNVRGQQIIITTTNGTAALEQVRDAKTVLLGALVNVAALAELIRLQLSRAPFVGLRWNRRSIQLGRRGRSRSPFSQSQAD